MRRLRLRVLSRRQYSVPGPNSLWHIDGNHKLIRSVILADKHASFYRCIKNCFTIKLCFFVCSQLPDRWRFVVHGGVDGFSRFVVYLTVAGNNRASTVLQSFIAAVEQYGLPSRVQSDKGGRIQM